MWPGRYLFVRQAGVRGRGQACGKRDLPEESEDDVDKQVHRAATDEEDANRRHYLNRMPVSVSAKWRSGVQRQSLC